MAKFISAPSSTEVRHRARAEGGDTLFSQWARLSKQLHEAYTSGVIADQERLRRLTENCFSVHRDLEDISVGKKPVSAITEIAHTLYEGVTSPIEQWSQEAEGRMSLYDPSLSRSELKDVNANVTKAESVEAVVYEFVEDDAVVVLMVENQAEKHIMSKSLLARAGITHRGQPFTIDVREETTSEGVTIVKRIRTTGTPDKWTAKPLRPDLNIEKFKRPPEQKNAQD